MAKNLIQKDGRYIDIGLAGKVSGNPVMLGGIRGVALTDSRTNGHLSIDRGPGVYSLSVKGVDDNGNAAVAFGDKLYYTEADTVKLSKRQSGKFYGFAFGTVNSGATTAINVLLGNLDIGGADIPDQSIRHTKFDRDFVYEDFRYNPICHGSAGAAITGATGETNLILFPNNAFEYHVKGAGQTILGPTISASGLLFTLDGTNDEGVEITQGITARCPVAFTVGTSPAFYAKARLIIPDVSGTDDCAFGFRKAEAYQAAIDNYDEMACLNVISGNITEETILNNGATVSTDTTLDWADAGEHTLEVYVAADGAVTFKVDGTAVPTSAAYTFGNGEIVVPFLYFLHAADVAESTVLVSWEIGLQ